MILLFSISIGQPKINRTSDATGQMTFPHPTRLRRATFSRRGEKGRRHLNMARYLSTLALVTIVTGTWMTGSTLPPFLRVASDSIAVLPSV